MLKKLFTISTLCLLAFGSCIISASANEIENKENISPLTVENPGSASVPVELGKLVEMKDSANIRIVDGTANLYVKANGGTIIAEIFYVYEFGPDILYKTYTVKSGETLNTTIKNFDTATYKLRLRKTGINFNYTGYGHLAD